MICPKCNGQMEMVSIEGSRVDRCSQCRGIWFDMLEAKKLRKISKSAELDEPVAVDMTEFFGDRRPVKCPKCNTLMTEMADKDQPDLNYEKCPVCYGIWFDAGEFSAYRKNGILNSVKQFFSRLV